QGDGTGQQSDHADQCEIAHHRGGVDAVILASCRHPDLPGANRLYWLTSFQLIALSPSATTRTGTLVASSASERTDGEAINQVARNCGSLAIECSDVAGYVAGVNERISRNLRMLDGLEEVTTRLMADQARV